MPLLVFLFLDLDFLSLAGFCIFSKCSNSRLLQFHLYYRSAFNSVIYIIQPYYSVAIDSLSVVSANVDIVMGHRSFCRWQHRHCIITITFESMHALSPNTTLLKDHLLCLFLLIHLSSSNSSSPLLC